jgi:acyl carrier protein
MLIDTATEPTTTEATVVATIVELLDELDELDEGDVPTVEPTSTFPDLGVTSLLMARLVLELEEAFGVEPFEDEEASVADLRTVGDLVAVFRKARGEA